MAKAVPFQNNGLRKEFVAEQTQVPFDFAQGRLSTTIGAQYAPISAPDKQKG
jgi:hypothetical protein